MDKAMLLQIGFAERTYEGQEGVFLTKEATVWDFRYAREHIVDNDSIRDEDRAVMEITPAGNIQFQIPSADYIEGPYPLESEEGKGLLNDCQPENAPPRRIGRI